MSASDAHGNLAAKRCVPCRGDTPPLRGEALRSLQRAIDAEWQIVDEHHLERPYRFRNFREALAFTNQVGEMAEEQRHHPDLTLAWGRVGVSIWTHKIDGLTESDFVFAAKCDTLYRNSQG
jgi:4a-hydroxytetrahydrobiopterin dehydratase